MSFIEKQRHGDQYYYYLVKNVRMSPTVVKKTRIFLGKKVPPKEELEKLLKEIEKKAPKPYKARHLSKGLIERIEDLHASVAVSKGQPSEVAPKDFLVRFTYNTNAIEGNPLTLRQTALILSDNISPQGASTEDVVEAMNGKDAWEFVKKHKGGLSEVFLKKIQKAVTRNTKCRIQGDYRDGEVGIGGSEWKPPPAKEVKKLMAKMVKEYKKTKSSLHPVELAAWFHNRFVQIHPFSDGNGRAARLAMNWILMKKRFPPVIISVRNKEEYYDAIEAFDSGDPKPFAVFLAKQLLEQYSVLEEK